MKNPGLVAAVVPGTYPFASLSKHGLQSGSYVKFKTTVIVVGHARRQTSYNRMAIPVLVPSGDVLWLDADCVQCVP